MRTPSLKGSRPMHQKKAAMAAGRLMLRRLRELFSRRESFAFETTLSGRAYRSLLKEMKEADYRIELDFLWLPAPEQSINRVANRVTQGGHHIPEDVIRRRHSKGLVNLFSIYRPLLDRWSIRDNTHSPALEIATETQGFLLVFEFEAFANLEQLVKDIVDE